MIAPSLAYIADVVPPVHRAACFGAIMASFSVAVLIGPPLGALLQPATAPAVTIGVVVLCMLCTLILLPESLSPQAKQQVRIVLSEWSCVAHLAGFRRRPRRKLFSFGKPGIWGPRYIIFEDHTDNKGF